MMIREGVVGQKQEVRFLGLRDWLLRVRIVR